MVIGDDEIRNRITSSQLLEGYDNGNIENGTYTLRAGHFIKPESGEEIDFATANTGLRKHGWTIGPTEVIVIMTSEVVKIPSDLCAIYAPLNRLSRQGLMLINASLIEPGYNGPLSCFLINTGSKAVFLKPGEPISKIMFLQLQLSGAAPTSKVVGRDEYRRTLAGAALNFQSSFLDVSGIEERAAKKAKEDVRNSVRFAVVVLGALVLFGTLEPLFSKLLYDKTGIASVSQRTEDALKQKAYQDVRDDLSRMLIEMKSQKRAEPELDRILKRLDELEGARSAADAAGKSKAATPSAAAPKK